MTHQQEFCCEPFKKAHEHGTDNEGYGQLVCYTVIRTDPLEYAKDMFIGSGLPPIKFCPWCGAAK